MKAFKIVLYAILAAIVGYLIYIFGRTSSGASEETEKETGLPATSNCFKPKEGLALWDEPNLDWQFIEQIKKENPIYEAHIASVIAWFKITGVQPTRAAHDEYKEKIKSYLSRPSLKLQKGEITQRCHWINSGNWPSHVDADQQEDIKALFNKYNICENNLDNLNMDAIDIPSILKTWKTDHWKVVAYSLSCNNDTTSTDPFGMSYNSQMRAANPNPLQR